MKTVPAGEFKQRCLRLLDEVRDGGEEIVVTKRGTPVARLVPIRSPSDWMGSMADQTSISGDIVEPVGLGDWDALR